MAGWAASDIPDQSGRTALVTGANSGLGLRAAEALAVANAVFVVLLLLSGMVFPLAKLPSGLRSAARALPSTALAEAARGALSDDASVPGRVWPVLVVWAVAAIALAVALFRWEPDD